jgi:hypothetical protein
MGQGLGGAESFSTTAVFRIDPGPPPSWPWCVFVLLLGYTGLRWGEATALRVCDIDLARRRIDVHRAFSNVGRRIVLGTPKLSCIYPCCHERTRARLGPALVQRYCV